MKSSILSFFEFCFWSVGAFCVYWLTIVMVTIHRFNEVELPLLGQCTQMEAVIFTLSCMWAPLALLHLCLHGFQKTSIQAGDKAPYLPGAIGDQEVPVELAMVRVGLFAVLLIWPTFSYGYLTGRAINHYAISAHKSGDGGSARLTGGDLLLFPLKRPTDATQGQGPYWWVNAKRHEPESEKNADVKKTVSALAFQPLVFVLLCVAGVLSMVVHFINGFWGKNINLLFRKRVQPSVETAS